MAQKTETTIMMTHRSLIKNWAMAPVQTEIQMMMLSRPDLKVIMRKHVRM
jgi:hypothetical protein